MNKHIMTILIYCVLNTNKQSMPTDEVSDRFAKAVSFSSDHYCLFQLIIITENNLSQIERCFLKMTDSRYQKYKVHQSSCYYFGGYTIYFFSLGTYS